MQRATSFEGETGPYIQYSYARCFSILEKYSTCSWKNDDFLWEDAVQYLNTIDDKEILFHLASFPELVQLSAQEYKPNIIARFLLELCHLFNRYYHHHYFLDENTPKLSQSRIVLLASIRSMMGKAMDLVCVPKVEVM